MSTEDIRVKSIKHWLKQSLNLEIAQFEPASCDASFRRYFRVHHQDGQNIVMDAPPEKENIKPFLCIAELFKKSELNVPTIVHKNLSEGFLLIEDFGKQCFLGQVSENNATDLYHEAFNSLLKLHHNIDLSTCQLPQYDEALLQKELEIFYHWFLQQTLSISVPDHIKANLNHHLIKSALDQPQICVHRDFHSRNLMVMAENKLGIIDFQDAVIGPVTYDLVSLLRDCYVSWPEHSVQQWLTDYYQKIHQAGLINADIDTYTRWFDLMGLQRHLKAIGIFCRLNIRDNKPNYLADIPRTLEYVKLICQKYPQLAEFNLYLNQTILPAYK